MKISNKNKEIIYNCIRDNIIDLRLELEKESKSSSFYLTGLDGRLFDLELKIWKDIREKLKI